MLPFRLAAILTALFLMFACDDPAGPRQNGDEDTSDPVITAHRQSPGSSAGDFIRAGDFRKLVIELRYHGEATLEEETVEALEAFLNKFLDKPGGINIIIGDPLEAVDENTYSVDDVRDMEDENRREYNEEDVLKAFVLIVDGNDSRDTNQRRTLGVAYYNTSTALFHKTIRDLSGGMLQPSRHRVETTVLLHEFGHLMGLVNIGTPMVDDHEGERAHCNVDECLMFYAMKSDEVVDHLLGTGGVPELDEFCRKDLEAGASQ